MNQETVMTCRNLNIFYGEKQAVFDVDLDILKNKVTAIIGPSGCGKSTLLRSLNRMNDVVPSFSMNGVINFDGRMVLKSDP